MDKEANFDRIKKLNQKYADSDGKGGVMNRLSDEAIDHFKDNPEALHAYLEMRPGEDHRQQFIQRERRHIMRGDSAGGQRDAGPDPVDPNET